MRSARTVVHEFTLVLRGFSRLTEEVEAALFEAGCDDALLGLVDGVPFLDFTREGRSLPEAVLSAIRDVAGARIGAEVVRVEPDDPVTASEIARRAGRSREGVRLLIHGERGPGEFPAPIGSLRSGSPTWSWAEVARWFVEVHRASGTPQAIVEDALFVAAVNTALSLRTSVPGAPAIDAVGRILRTVERPCRASSIPRLGRAAGRAVAESLRAGHSASRTRRAPRA